MTLMVDWSRGEGDGFARAIVVNAALAVFRAEVATGMLSLELAEIPTFIIPIVE